MLNDIIAVPRTDAVYNMHSYLTKVPIGAIIPMIEEFTEPGGLVVDIFAGSGMTAVAAKMCGRNAVVSDISKLGRHIGEGYLTQVSPTALERATQAIIQASRQELGRLYRTFRAVDGQEVEVIRTIWSFVYQCRNCGGSINYYHAFRLAGWNSKAMRCGICAHPFSKRDSQWAGETPVLTVVSSVSGKQVEQAVSSHDLELIRQAEALDCRSKIPSIEITADREMHKRSALGKWKLTETRNFFSQRNAAILFDLWQRIKAVENEGIRKKLSFAFTAILARASKRYQWSPKVPLNAANQNYYIAPVFFEWNVYDLFLRKIEAAKKSDAFIFENLQSGGNTSQRYVTASAGSLGHLENDSVDYIFTDPPFGSNIFYADMNLFHEAWLGEITDPNNEAVVKTIGTQHDKEVSREFYRSLLARSFSEAYRILREGGRLSVVFGNSKGEIWAMAQEAFEKAGFTGKPERINILDKGQRSVKGLASGRENVATLDLIVTFRKGASNETSVGFESHDVSKLIDKTLTDIQNLDGMTASHVYLETLRNAMYSQLDLASIDLSDIMKAIEIRGYSPDDKTGKLARKNQAAAAKTEV